MLGDGLLILTIAIITFLPIMFWGYIFSYIDGSLANRKRFFLGILAGSISVVPLIYFENIMQIFNISLLNVFYYAKVLGSIISVFSFSFSLFLFLSVIIFFSFLFSFISEGSKGLLLLFLKNFCVFSIFLLFLSGTFYALHIFFSFFPDGNNLLEHGINFGSLAFNSLKLIIFYYLLIGLIEEASKHFNFLGTGIFSVHSNKSLVLYAIFVALGFAFIENFLYIFLIYKETGFNSELLQLYFFRSVFSLILHVLCSSIIAYSFGKVFMQQRGVFSLQYIKVFFLGIGISVFLHAIYDVSLSIGFSTIMFFYFVGGYLYVSSIFYRGKEDRELTVK